MSTITLLPEGGGEAIVVAEKQTVIGRGPFLKVVDKRVSRNHAKLEVTDGKLNLTPVHTNPCFFRRGSQGRQEILQRDVQQPLEDGDMFGLLPDQLFYTVCYGDSVKRNGESKERGKKEAAQQASPGKKERVSTPGIKGTGPGKKGRVSTPGVKEDLEEEEADVKKRKVSFRDTVCADGKKMALPLTKTRTLPAWMVRLSHTNAPPAKKKAAPVRTTAPAKRAAPSKAAPKKKAVDVDFLDDEEEEEEDDKPARRRGGKAKPCVDDDEDDEEDRESAKKKKVRTQQQRKAESDPQHQQCGASAPPGRGRNSRSRRQEDSDDDSVPRPKRAATKNVGSYEEGYTLGDEFEDSDRGAEVKGDSDSDFKMDANDDGDSGSDWGKRPASPKKQARKPAARSSARKGRKRKVHMGSDSEDDEDFEEWEDEYVPRPSRRRGGASGGGRKAADSEEEEEEEVVQKKGKKKSPAKTAGKKGKTPCYYGAKCYRRNPDHFKQFSHPGDSEGEEEEEQSEDDKGAGKNRKKADSRPRKAEPMKAPAKKKRKGEDEEDGEDLPNTYDYNDSFIDDAESQSLSQTQHTEEGSEEEEEEEDDDVEELKQEAKSFVRNKKMMKPVARV